MSRKRKQKLPKESFEAKTTDLNHEGRGVAHIDGKATFIRGALANETVKFIYTRKKGSFDEGLIESVIEPAANRAEPPCPHYGNCGGCSMQHLSHADQIKHKQRVLKELLEHQAKTEPKEWLEPITGPELGYRRSARLSVKHVFKKEKVLVGFRELNGRMIADIDSCEVLDPKIGKRLPMFQKLIEGLSVSDKIPQIEVAGGDEEIALIFRHMEPPSEKDLIDLKSFGQEFSFDIYLQPKGPDTVHCIYPENSNERLSYQADGLNFHFHPTDFIQVNKDINAKMIDKAIELLNIQNDERVLDLFCGLGNFSLPLANRAKSVLAVEGSDEMVKRGYENAKLNSIDNIEFKAANLFETEHEFLKQEFDKILLDPPRAGAQEIMPLLNAKTILYISCNPITLARDAGILVERGYTLEKSGVMDMFPHTSHVESIALFCYTGKQ